MICGCALDWGGWSKAKVSAGDGQAYGVRRWPRVGEATWEGRKGARTKSKRETRNAANADRNVKSLHPSGKDKKSTASPGTLK